MHFLRYSEDDALKVHKIIPYQKVPALKPEKWGNMMLWCKMEYKYANIWYTYFSILAAGQPFTLWFKWRLSVTHKMNVWQVTCSTSHHHMAAPLAPHVFTCTHDKLHSITCIWHLLSLEGRRVSATEEVSLQYEGSVGRSWPVTRRV